MSVLLALALSSGAVSSPEMAPAVPAEARIPYALQIIEGRSGRLYCLRPASTGDATLPAAILKRPACRKAVQWAQRGVGLREE